MAEETTTTTTAATTQDPVPEKTFTQAEVDTIVSKRLAKAMKGVPGEEEITAYRAWKESQQSEKEKLDAIVKERDESKAALATAQEELEQHKREKFLLSKGVSPDDVDYYVFKISKMVDENTDFEAAAEKVLADQKPSNTMRVDFSGSVGGGLPQKNPNEQMNSLIRGFRK